MKRKIIAAAITGLLLAQGCSNTASDSASTGKQTSAAAASAFAPRAVQDSLEQGYAAQRAALVSNVDYRLSIDFTRGDTEFAGTSLISFDYKPLSELPLTVDFYQGDVEAVLINGKAAEFSYQKWFISIPSAQLASGHNQLEIRYRAPYGNTGTGLHRFVDPEDKGVYLYTDFEPYDANRLFPHFDQPDLKARYLLDVKAPADWQVVANQREDKVEAEGDNKHWQFKQTERFSSYIFALHAGPYAVWEDNSGAVPLRLFARKTMARYVKPEEWFGPTQKSMTFFNQYFDIPYPYHKYDQLVVPDFNSGAMENVGAVTFNESYLSRGEKTQDALRNQANTIAHELAHMWFGNLVTMKWWDGLWLNESFATFMSNLALYKTEMFPGIWENYYSGTKQWAYDADDSVTTHPIQLDVANTTEAFANFDGITYGKGGSVLKQLWFYLGEDKFRDGVSHYLKTHREGNTQLSDFIGALGEKSALNLDAWSKEWLYTPGLNTLQVSFSCEGDKIASFSLQQGHGEHDNSLRTQKTRIALYNQRGGKLNKTLTQDVIFSGSSTKVTSLVGARCPDLVYPNDEDFAYIKVRLDTQSLNTLKTQINQVEDAYTRLMLWQSLSNGVKETDISPQQFIDFALTNLPAEQDETIINAVADGMGYASSFLWEARRQGKDVQRYITAMEDFSWQQLQSAKPGSDLQKLWFYMYLSSIDSPHQWNILNAMARGTRSIDGLTLDQDKRWRIVSKLNRELKGDYDTLLATEKQRDGSDRGKLFALASEVGRPTAANKAKWFEIIQDDNQGLKLREQQYILSSLPDKNHPELMAPFHAEVLKTIPELNKTADDRFLVSYVNALLPSTCSRENAAELGTLLDEWQGLKFPVVRAIKLKKERVDRCVKITAAMN